MLKKIYFVFLITIFFFYSTAKADEGMWLLQMLNKNYDDMKKAGFKLTPEDIYNLNHTSIKDAIVQFGKGCSGSIVSKDGLLLTNHHCGYGYIQANSSSQNDYLTDGFWAKSKKEELINEGLFVKFLIRIDDVTSKVIDGITIQMSEKERFEKIAIKTKAIIKEASTNNKHTFEVKSFFNNNEYYLLTYEIYTDIRLVGAPPTSIGGFGGDIDNWMWPRHTGDFSLFRVYSAPDGSPSNYSPENVPLKVKYHLPISLSGVNLDDFTMVVGYPGTTTRYASSIAVKEATETINPAIIKIREKKLEVLSNYMNASKEVKMQYAAKYATTSNYWKYYLGQTKSLNKQDIYEKKKASEAKFEIWVNQNEGRKLKYGNVLNDIEITTKALAQYSLVKTLYGESVTRGSDALRFSAEFIDLYKLLAELEEKNSNKEALVSDLKDKVELYFKDYNFNTDKKLFQELLNIYYNSINKEYFPSVFNEISEKYQGNFKKFTENVYEESIFTNKKKLIAFLNNPTSKALDKDDLFNTMYSLYGNCKKLDNLNNQFLLKLEKAKRLYIDGFKSMETEKFLYPDANQTMRLSYGKVLAYNPSDAIDYNYYTTIDGLMEKKDNETDEFLVFKKLEKLYETKDFGSYTQNGELRVNFITNNDVAGGSSGSPVLNAKGEIVGLVFDLNWEAMSGNFVFEPNLQRTVSVDIKYILFIIDKYADAKNIIEELALEDKK